ALRRAAETRGESLDRKIELAAHESADCRRVDPTGQKGAERHVRDETAADAARQDLFELVGEIAHRSVGKARQARPEFEVAASRNLSVCAPPQPMRRRQLFHLAIYRPRRADVLEAQDLGNRIDIDTRVEA